MATFISQDDFLQLQSIRDVFRVSLSLMHAHPLYFGHGTDNAWDESLYLIFELLHLPHVEYPVLFDARLTEAEKLMLYAALKKRILDRIPVAYLTQRAWFAGLSFYVDERVIIPRSPFAELIQQGFSPWLDMEHINCVLELCTGSACMAISLAKYFPHLQIDAVDISPEALAVAQKNIALHEVEQQVHLYQGDLFSPLVNKKYDLIISNPPYVDAADMQALPVEFTHEPTLALAAGEDGLVIAKRILATAKNYLTPMGTLWLEVGNSQTALMQQYPQLALTWVDLAAGGEGICLIEKQHLV